MPNFHTTNLEPLSYPVFVDGVEFLGSFSNNGDILVSTMVDGVQFFIAIYKKDGKFLVKYEKSSRPPQVKLVQRALVAYEKLSSSKTTHSNIHSSKNHLEKRSSFLKCPEDFLQIDEKELVIEVGFGSGRHLLHQAKQNPTLLHVGVEIYQPSIEQVLKHVESEGIANVVVVDFDARILLEFLHSNSVSKIFVHFPVPWDKKPHRRVISKAFLDEAVRVLKVGGTLELRTDSKEYYEYALEVFEEPKVSKMTIYKNRDLEISSKYEDRWKRQEKDIYDLIFTNYMYSEENSIIKPLEFDFKPNADLELKSFKTRGDGWFVNVKKIYKSDDKGDNVFACEVSLGANDRPESRFVLVGSEGVYYFPSPLLSTKSNELAHEILDKWIKNEICN